MIYFPQVAIDAWRFQMDNLYSLQSRKYILKHLDVFEIEIDWDINKTPPPLPFL